MSKPYKIANFNVNTCPNPRALRFTVASTEINIDKFIDLLAQYSDDGEFFKMHNKNCTTTVPCSFVLEVNNCHDFNNVSDYFTKLASLSVNDLRKEFK